MCYACTTTPWHVPCAANRSNLPHPSRFTSSPVVNLHLDLASNLLLLFFCSDFDEMEQLFSQQINPNLDMAELEAMCTEFKNDYNQRHFVRNETFKKAAEGITGETRKIFIEFLERSCTAEFSGFLLYKVCGVLGVAQQSAAQDMASISQ